MVPCQIRVAILAPLLVLVCGTSHAALHSRVSGQAYYDDVLHVTWLADANAGAGSIYDDGTSTTDGRMTWSSAQAWIDSLNGASYLGVSNWRLPNAYANAFTTLPIDCSTDTEPNCRDNEMGYMYWQNLVTGASPSPFTNVQPYAYWSGTDYFGPSTHAWWFNFSNGFQNQVIKTFAFHAWAMRDGDIALALLDSDGDGVADEMDNCTVVANPTQLDTDGDSFGNICDPDLDNNGIVNINDFNRLKARLNITPVVDVDADLDGNGAVNINDFNRLKSYLNKNPGPSGLYP